ncbi:MAG: glutamine amidotransferase [Thermomicrobiales bacterium]|nr:glutamine amidotransferase [Thermomicrobiales bacterium]MCO5226076.1 glutamine amidotransferase [Thermomicrobiales bacterium]MCO5229333.1 glutamine amidotransferase [Thermomicrobiales bacterium]
MTMQITIGWLYGAKMNIYGDRGNVVALQQRARWRGVDAQVQEIGIGEPVPAGIDIFFWGGGQDQEQVAVAKDIAGAKGEAIREAVERGAALLSICGGYQLLGHGYQPHDGEMLGGIGVFDAISTAGPTRFIGNVTIGSPQFNTLVGFENHSGLTTLQGDCQPLGKVVHGHGNNGRDGTEGAIYKNAIGCYLHGALLPKNPHLTDWLLQSGLRHRYTEVDDLTPLDDALEFLAHENALSRSRTQT